MTTNQRDAILKIMQQLQQGYEGLQDITESYKRDEAMKLLQDAHQAVALLLVS